MKGQTIQKAGMQRPGETLRQKHGTFGGHGDAEGTHTDVDWRQTVWGDTERGVGISALTSVLWHKHVFLSESHAPYEFLKIFHGLWVFLRVSPCEEVGQV